MAWRGLTAIDNIAGAKVAPARHGPRGRRFAAAVVVAALLAVCAPAPTTAAPAPCGGQPHITDAKGDGHHTATDVLSAWFSEAAGRLQGVIKVDAGNWAPDHPPAAAEWALLFEVGGVIRYVRATAPDLAPQQFDHGTWTPMGGFANAGPTTGALAGGPGGTATIDVPGATGAVSGAVLANPFVLTYDGDGLIDRAPGGTTLPSTEYGASHRVGPCGGPGGALAVTSVQLRARGKLVGGGSVAVSGSIAPGRGGVPVELSVKTRRSAVMRLTTKADGTFAASIPVNETTELRAIAEGIGSQTRRVVVLSKVRIKVKRLRRGGVVIRGTVRPKVPGRVLLLRTSSALPAARTVARKGRFSFRFKHLRRGRYQAVFIPSKGRAERATSNKGAIK